MDIFFTFISFATVHDLTVLLSYWKTLYVAYS